jgi:hypothetical protein
MACECDACWKERCRARLAEEVRLDAEEREYFREQMALCEETNS